MDNCIHVYDNFRTYRITSDSGITEAMVNKENSVTNSNIHWRHKSYKISGNLLASLECCGNIIFFLNQWHLQCNASSYIYGYYIKQLYWVELPSPVVLILTKFYCSFMKICQWITFTVRADRFIFIYMMYVIPLKIRTLQQ